MTGTRKTRRTRANSKQKPVKVPMAAPRSAEVLAAASVPSPRAASPKRILSASKLLGVSVRLLWNRRRFFILFIILYAVLNLIFVRSFASNVSDLKSQLSSAVGGNAALTGLGTYALLTTTTSSATSGGTAFQYVLLVLCSLACIYALRHFLSEKASTALRLRDSFYDGMYPLVPFLLVLVVLSLELVPLAAGGSLLGVVLANGIAVDLMERLLFFLIFGALAAISVWLMTMTICAPYIVTLPGGRPVKALRDSARITKGRRLNVLRKLLFLALVVLIISAVVLVPVILIWAPLTSVLFFVLGALALPFLHAYLYSMYRELLA